MSNPIDWYEQNSASSIDSYEALDPETLHDWLKNFLPRKKPSMVLDIGAGSGRDAAWLAKQGYDVVAVEPSAAMRESAQNLHPETAIHWTRDKLPLLQRVTRSGMAFDFILLSAVWMHVPKGDSRKRAFRKLVGLLKPGGVLALTLRMGPVEKRRGIHPVSLDEIRSLARDHALVEVYQAESADHSGRKNIRWIHIALKAPDDGTGALPLLRHVILKDAKSSTYKLALLRTLCRIANDASGFTRSHGDDFVAVPLGLVALTWIRLYKPLLVAGLPQLPKNHGYEQLRFAKEPFRQLAETSDLDLRVGVSFSGDIAKNLHRALRTAAETIDVRPATHLTYPNEKRILPINREPDNRQPRQVLLDADYLFSFGKMRVPRNLWLAMQRYDVWIEPALIAEWSKMIKDYAKGQGRSVDDAVIGAAMTWNEPLRDVSTARERAINLLKDKGKLYCVWSGKKLDEDNLDMDHCLPWSAWPCGDLWNLMPASRNVNQRQKKDHLPSDGILRSAQDRILNWWDEGYIEASEPIREQFWIETRSSLPGGVNFSRHLPDIFDSLCLQRMRLKYNQQVPEWPKA